MKLNIGNRIAELRRENNKTQEQIADYVGVSVAAVSKWETNQSYPDITLLPSIADFFEVSIDSLIGYTIADNGKKLKEIHESIHEAVSNDDYGKALPVILEALKKYPNDFLLLDSAARMLSNKAWESETKEQDFKDAVSYRERAIKCVKPEDKHTAFWLKKEIAQTYDSMGDTDTAIEKLQEINESNVFGFEVALLKYKKGEKEEAIQLIQSQLWQAVFQIYRITSKLAEYYEEKGDLEMTVASEQFHTQMLSALTNDTPNYVDIWCSSSYRSLAGHYMKLGRYDDMWKSLEKAVYHAARFDKKPSYKLNVITFLEELNDGNQMSNNSGALACHGLLNGIKEQFHEFAKDERYIAICNELETAKRTKVEAGVWAE